MPMSMGGLHSPVKQLFPTPPSKGNPNVSPLGRDEFERISTRTYAHMHTHARMSTHTHTYTHAHRKRVVLQRDMLRGTCSPAPRTTTWNSRLRVMLAGGIVLEGRGGWQVVGGQWGDLQRLIS